MTDRQLTVLLAGGGDLGFEVARILDDQEHNVIIIERDANRCRTLADEYVATIIHGDATETDTLEQAEPDRCDIIAALTGDTGTNVLVCALCSEVVTTPCLARCEGSIGTEELEGVKETVTEATPPEEIVSAIISLVDDGT